MDEPQAFTRLQALCQAEAPFVYAEFMEPVTYTPAPGTDPTTAVCIQAMVELHETGQLTDEGIQQRYHRMCTLTTFQCYGPFVQEDKFEFRGLCWRLSGSSQTTVMDGMQTLELVSKETFEIGDFRRKQ